MLDFILGPARQEVVERERSWRVRHRGRPLGLHEVPPGGDLVKACSFLYGQPRQRGHNATPVQGEVPVSAAEGELVEVVHEGGRPVLCDWRKGGI